MMFLMPVRAEWSKLWDREGGSRSGPWPKTQESTVLVVSCPSFVTPAFGVGFLQVSGVSALAVASPFSSSAS